MKTRPLFSRAFTLMVVGQIVSLFGNAILRFALSLHVLETTGSAAAFGGVSALAVVPTLLCGPLGGVLADRVPRQVIMWGLDFATAGLTLGYALLFPGGGPLEAAGAMMVLLAAIQALYQPAVQASVPLLAPEGRLAAANGAVSQVQALANLLGPVLGGVLCTWTGLEPLLGVGSACFFASAVMELFLRIPFVRRAGGGSPFATAVRDLGEAGRFLLGERPALAGLAGLAALVNLTLSALLVVGLPYLVNVALALTPLHYSFAEAALSLGSVLGGVLAGPVLARRGVERRLLAEGTLPLLPLAAVLAMGLPAPLAYGAALGAVGMAAACAVLFTVAAMTALQRLVPPHLLGKAAAFLAALSTCAMPLGQGLYGLLFDALPCWAVFLLGGGLSLAAALAAGPVMGRLAGPDGAEKRSGGSGTRPCDGQRDGPCGRADRLDGAGADGYTRGSLETREGS